MDSEQIWADSARNLIRLRSDQKKSELFGWQWLVNWSQKFWSDLVISDQICSDLVGHSKDLPESVHYVSDMISDSAEEKEQKWK